MSALGDYLHARYNEDPTRTDNDRALIRWLDDDPNHLPADQRTAIRVRTEQALCILAQPYADRDDFNDAWRL